MARAIWKGAISFGLVHIPVALQSATSSENIDFDWLDQRTMDPVGYKRVNKVTGKEVSKKNIVKGVQYKKGKYILLSEEEIKSAHPKTTQTINIFSFVESKDIPLSNIDTPYYLSPDKRGEKVYALLRETLLQTDTVGLASVILHTKQHLAAVMPIDSALVLILLRWPSEVRSLDTLELTDATTKATLSKAEKDMAKRLVEDMKGKWEPDQYRDTFQEKIMALVNKKALKGEIESVEDAPESVGRKSADIIDLTELLKQSLRGKSEKKSSRSDGENEAKVTPIKSSRARPQRLPSKESSSKKTTPKEKLPSKSKAQQKLAAVKSVKATPVKAKSVKKLAVKTDSAKKQPDSKVARE